MLTHQRSQETKCVGQTRPLPGLSNVDAVLLAADVNGSLSVLQSLQPFGSQALRIEVPVGLPPPPEFVQVPRWTARLSTPTTAAVQGRVDGPALIFYAARPCSCSKSKRAAHGLLA